MNRRRRHNTVRSHARPRDRPPPRNGKGRAHTANANSPEHLRLARRSDLVLALRSIPKPYNGDPAYDVL
jgi:hypothetical protein